MDQYAAEFDRLIKFVSYMVADEGHRARRFMQGLRAEIQEFLVSRPLTTLRAIHLAARKQERATLVADGVRRAAKRGFDQLGGEAPQQEDGLFQQEDEGQVMFCNACSRTGHTAEDCWRAKWQVFELWFGRAQDQGLYQGRS